MTGLIIAALLGLYGSYIILAIRYCDYGGLKRPYKIDQRQATRSKRRRVRSWKRIARHRKGGVLNHD